MEEKMDGWMSVTYRAKTKVVQWRQISNKASE